MELRTERLVLRPARQGDLTDAHAYMGNAQAMRYWSTAPHRDLERTRVWLQTMIEASPDVCADFLIEFKGRVIGEVGAFPLPDFGFILHPDYWRRGFGFEAGVAAIQHIFETRPVDALLADVDPRNEASVSLLEKLGFQKTGEERATMRVAGGWVDSAYFRLSRSQAQS